MTLPIILASASPARLKLLKQISIIPDHIMPSDIDESQNLKETPENLAKRLAFEKATAIANKLEEAIIIGADTVPVVGKTVMRKSTNAEEVRTSLRMLSNRRHRVYTGVCVIRKKGDEYRALKKVVKSTLKFKKLSQDEIDYFCNLGEGIGKAGGYTVSGHAESYISFLSGSFSNIVGLPLFETANMLKIQGVSLINDKK